MQLILRARPQVAGADSETVSSDEQQERFLHQFLLRLRDQPVLANALFVIVVERNYGGAVLASRIFAACAAVPPCAAMTQDTDKKLRRVGVITTSEVKERMRVCLATMLRCDSVHYAEPFVSRALDARDQLTQQLRGYRFEVGGRAAPLKPPCPWTCCGVLLWCSLVVFP